MHRHPDRIRLLQGATNFRDLGGYIGHEGRPVRWGRLFRSDHLADLTGDDHARVQSLGLRRAFDFRGVRESAAKAYDLPGVRRHALTIEPVVAQRMDAMTAAGTSMTADLMAGLMRDLYRNLVNEHAHRFAELFEHLLEDDAPMVFHCTAGKDRTGIAAALILLALGVPRQTVEADYLLTNELYQHPPLPPSSTPPEALAVLWRVQEDFLTEGLAAIEQDQGGLERYFEHRLGLDAKRRHALRERYLSDN